MILLNFSHPLTPEHLARIEGLAGATVERVIDIPAAFDHQQPFDEQIAALIDEARLGAEAWQTTPLLVNPPAYNHAATTLLAHLHGRMGYFPTVLRLRPVQEATPPRFEVAELIDLQAVRNSAREQRRA